MLKVGDKLLCKPKDKPETAHCLCATVSKVEDGNVTISRSLKFGTLPIGRDLTLPETKLLEYYTPLNELSSGSDSDELPIYQVTVTRTGVVYVKAESLAYAMKLADRLTTDEISWSHDWSPTDAVEAQGYDGEVHTKPFF